MSHPLFGPEVRLMLAVQREEPGAFEKLVQRYWPRIFGHFFRRLGDRQEAEDLAQDVFLRLYRHRKRYQPRAKFATWLYHISRNVARNALRSRRRHPCLRVGSLAVFEEETPQFRPRREESSGSSTPAAATAPRRMRLTRGRGECLPRVSVSPRPRVSQWGRRGALRVSASDRPRVWGGRAGGGHQLDSPA